MKFNIEPNISKEYYSVISKEYSSYNYFIINYIKFKNGFKNKELLDFFISLHKQYSSKYIKENLKNLLIKILINPEDYSYNIVKNYINYLSKKYKINKNTFLYNTKTIYKKNIFINEECIMLEYENFIKYQKEIKNLLNKFKKNKNISIELINFKNIDLFKLMQSNLTIFKYMIEKNIISQINKINYNNKFLYLLEALILGSLTYTNKIVEDLIHKTNDDLCIKIYKNIMNHNTDYFNRFKDEKEIFEKNLNILKSKIEYIELKNINFNKSEKNKLFKI